MLVLTTHVDDFHQCRLSNAMRPDHLHGRLAAGVQVHPVRMQARAAHQARSAGLVQVKSGLSEGSASFTGGSRVATGCSSAGAGRLG